MNERLGCFYFLLYVSPYSQTDEKILIFIVIDTRK